MIPLVEFKKLLGNEAQNLSDEQIEIIRGEQYSLAQIIFEQWQKQKDLEK